MRRFVACATLSAALLAPCAAQTQRSPDRFGTLSSGAAFAVRELPGAPLTSIQLWFRVPSTGYAKPRPGIARLAATAAAASALGGGGSLAERIAEVGGELRINTYPDATAVIAVVPSARSASFVQAMAQSFFAARIQMQALDRAKLEVAQSGLRLRFQTGEALRELLMRAFFASGPAHYSAFPGDSEVSQFTLREIASFARQAFRPANAVFVSVGASVLSTAQRLAGTQVGAPNAGPPSPPAASPVPVSQPYSESALALGWLGPPIADERASTALDLVADYLFRSETGRVAAAATAHNAKSSVEGTFVTMRDAGMMMVTISGEDLATSRALALQAIESLKQPLSESDFGAARAGFTYHLLSDQETPEAQGESFGWYAVEGDPLYAPFANAYTGRYFAIVQTLTRQEVAAAVTRYLGAAPLVVTLVPQSGK